MQLAKPASRPPAIVARFGEDARRRSPGVEVGRVDRAEQDDDLVGAAHVAAGAAPRGHGAVVGLGVFQQPQPRRDVGELQLRRFLVRDEIFRIFL